MQRILDPIGRPRIRPASAFVASHRGYLLAQHLSKEISVSSRPIFSKQIDTYRDQQRQQRQQSIGVLPIPARETEKELSVEKTLFP